MSIDTIASMNGFSCAHSVCEGTSFIQQATLVIVPCCFLEDGDADKPSYTDITIANRTWCKSPTFNQQTDMLKWDVYYLEVAISSCGF